MEQNLVRVPFEVELAKKITSVDVDGRIIDNDGNHYRLVCFDLSDDKGKIIGLRKNNDYTETAFTFNDNGFCVQNPSRELFIEIPEYMTFKDGDIATLGWDREDGEYCEWITILKEIDVDKYNILTEDYVTVCLRCDAENYFLIDFDCKSDGANWVRKPTEPEKQKLIDALKASKDPKAKEYLKRFFNIEQKQEYEFKPFDKVLVRDDYKDSKWSCDLFSHKNEDGLYVCIGQIWEKCIPYEGNEHLLGTTDKIEEE